MGAQKSKLGKAKLQELAQKTSCKYFFIVLPGVGWENLIQSSQNHGFAVRKFLKNVQGTS